LQAGDIVAVAVETTRERPTACRRAIDLDLMTKGKGRLRYAANDLRLAAGGPEG